MKSYFKKTEPRNLPPQPLFRNRPVKDTETLFKAFSPNRLLQEPQYYGLLASIRISMYHMIATIDKALADAK